MKLKVLKEEDTPSNCTKRVVLSHDTVGSNEWVRDTCDNVFLMWSNSQGHRSDMVYDPSIKKRVEVDSPFEPELDKDGYETGYYKPKKDLIVIPVDIYEHSGIVWFLRGEGGPGTHCPFDSTCFRKEAPFYLYTNKERWDKFCGNCEWKFLKNGKPSKKLMEEAKKVARSEVEMMNLSEGDCYYGYNVEYRVTKEVVEKKTYANGTIKTEDRKFDDWEDGDDSCWGFLTDKPALEVDFPLGVPVVTDCQYLVGDTFEQEVFALSDDMTGKFISYRDGEPILVDDPIDALKGGRSYLESNRKHYENEAKKALTVVDVTERIWSRFPECVA